MPASNVSVGFLLSEKEQEVARLREQALTSLEGKLQDREQQLVTAHKKFAHLQQDYEYNLELLDGRDAELERYDKEFDAIRQELVTRDGLISQLHACLAKAESDANMEKERFGEVLADADKRLTQLDSELSCAKQAHEQALLRQQEHASQTERQLERDLADARRAVQKQWRELSASFEDQLRHMELECNIKLEQAAQQTEMATQQAAEREAEASQAHGKERSAADAAAEATQRVRELQKQNKALVSELERLQRVKDARIAQLEQECSRLQHQAGDLEGEHKGHLAEVVADVEAMKQAMTDQRDELDKAAQRAKRQHDEDLSVQKARLAILTGQRSQLQADLTEARTLLKLTSRQSSERLERLAAEKEAERSASQSQLADTHRQHEAELRQSREECWAYQQELTALREKLATLKTTLEDRRRDVVSYKEQLVASGDRERELQRQMTQAGLQAEALLEGSQAAVAAESEELVKGLIQQRDTANDALVEAQAALLAKEDDLVMLRRELLSLKAQLHKPSDSATLPTKPHPSAAQHAAAHHSASAESKAQPSSSGKPDLHQGSNKSRGAESAEVGDSGLPSLSLPATPHSPGGSPRGGLAELRQSLEHGLRGPVSQPTLEILLNEQAELKAALQEAEDQNQRLRITISAMRSDMESMHHQSSSPGPQANPSQTPFTSPPPPFPLPYQQYQSSSHGQTTTSEEQHALLSGLHVQQQQQQEEEVKSLRQQLKHAQTEAEELAAENERLMEMSNALRSEHNRAALSQRQQHIQAVATLGNEGSVQQPYASLPLVPGLQPQQLYHQAQQDFSMGTKSMPLGQPLQQPLTPWPYQGIPQQPQQGVPQQPQIQQAVVPGQGQGSPAQTWQNVQAQPAGQLAVLQGQTQPALTHSTADDSLPSEVWQQLQRIESLAEQISAAQAGKGPAPDTPLPLNTLNHNNRAARTGGDAKDSVSSVPMNADPSRPRPQSASDRSTPSQRARLKALQQRQAPRSRIRNYNQQDDTLAVP